MHSIFSDIVIVDLSRVLAGPYCTMMLGDLGATVIKVEHPGCGDDTRRFGPPFQARGFVWECEHPTVRKIALVGSPINLSETPPKFYEAPPLLGEDNALLLNEGVSFEKEEVPCLETRHREQWDLQGEQP
ncbi:MAG: hypothetical protein E6J34_00690 [Chloroflexi bacterium]|nr:MAG: hypothetical protein E6J34_00690 [Chloroflexota bacterium]